MNFDSFIDENKIKSQLLEPNNKEVLKSLFEYKENNEKSNVIYDSGEMHVSNKKLFSDVLVIVITNDTLIEKIKNNFIIVDEPLFAYKNYLVTLSYNYYKHTIMKFKLSPHCNKLPSNILHYDETNIPFSNGILLLSIHDFFYDNERLDLISKLKSNIEDHKNTTLELLGEDHKNTTLELLGEDHKNTTLELLEIEKVIYRKYALDKTYKQRLAVIENDKNTQIQKILEKYESEAKLLKDEFSLETLASSNEISKILTNVNKYKRDLKIINSKIKNWIEIYNSNLINMQNNKEIQDIYSFYVNSNAEINNHIKKLDLESNKSIKNLNELRMMRGFSMISDCSEIEVLIIENNNIIAQKKQNNLLFE
jgi:hypothetical protein